MKNNFTNFITLLFLCLTANLFAQNDSFERFYGKTSANESFNSLKKASDGGYVAVGQSNTPGLSGQMLFARFDENGNLQQNFSYGSELSERANAVAVLDNGFLLGGAAYDLNETTSDAVLLFVDEAGVAGETIVFGATGDDYVADLTTLSNGNIVVVSALRKDNIVGNVIDVRIYDQELNLLQSNEFASENLDVPSFVLETNDNKILVGGASNGFSFLVQFTADLSAIEFTQTDLGGSGYISLLSAAQINDETIAIIAEESGFGNNEILLVNTAGEVIADAVFENTGISGDLIKIERIDDDNFAVLANFTGDEAISFHTYTISSNTVTEGDTQFDVLIAADFIYDNDSYVTVGLAQEMDADRWTIVNFDPSSIATNWETQSSSTEVNISYLGRALAETDDGKMYLMSLRTEGNQENEISIRKVSVNGYTEWETIFGQTFIALNSYHLTATADGGCVVVYSLSNFDRIAQKVNSDGSLGWMTTFGQDTNFFPIFGDLVVNSQGDLYYCTTITDGTRVAYVAKLTGNGELLWTNTYQVEDLGTRGYGATLAANGDILIACNLELDGSQAGIIRIDGDGNEIWDNSYSLAPLRCRFTGIVEASDGTIFAGGLVGENTFADGKGNIFHIDADGDVLQGGVVEANEPNTLIYDLTIAEDGALYSLNNFSSTLPENEINSFQRFRTIEINRYSADLEVEENYSFGLGGVPSSFKMISNEDGGVAAYGTVGLNNTGYGHLIRVNPNGVSSTINITFNGKLQVNPTISDGNFTVKIDSSLKGEMTVNIFDINGRLVKNKELNKTTEILEQNFHLNETIAGTYFVEVLLGKMKWTKQIVLN